MREESRQLLEKIDSREFVVTLEITARALTTEDFAGRLQQWQNDGRDVSLLIGGPEGLAPEVSARSDFKLSLSAMTLPHPLARVVLVEQLYRAHSILTNHPYHRA